MKRILICILYLLPYFTIGQENVKESKVPSISQYQTINMETGIKKLLIKSCIIRKKNIGIKGFCVQIYNGQNRQEAQMKKHKFIKKFPEISSITYERVNPNWKVRIGKFRTKLEAEKLQSLIKNSYPHSFVSEIVVPLGEFD